MSNLSLPRTAKYILKRLAQHVAAQLGNHIRLSKEPELLILMYHRILPQGDPRSLTEEPGMLVTPETFRLHLRLIKEYFVPIQLSQWFEEKEAGTLLNQKYCAITFDDGWLDNYEFAYPILCDMGVPATIFAVSEMMNTNRLFWPERLTKLICFISQQLPAAWDHPSLAWLREPPIGYEFSTALPNQDKLSDIIAKTKALTDQEIHKRLDLIEKQLQLSILKRSPSLLGWDQIREMTASGCIEIGSHTCQHIRLSEQTPAEVLHREILFSKQQLQEQTGQKVATFCFPNGDYSPVALEKVMQTYTGAVTTQTGWNKLSTNNYLLKRIGVHEDISQDKTAFLARISGWM